MYTLSNIMNNPAGLIILLLVVVLLFGSQKIPELMRSIGQGKRAFEDGMKETPAEKEARTGVK